VGADLLTDPVKNYVDADIPRIPRLNLLYHIHAPVAFWCVVNSTYLGAIMTYYLHYFVPCFLGVLSHLVYFRNGEHHLYSLLYLKTALISPCVVLIALRIFGAYGSETLVHVLRLQLLYMFSVWLSMLFYRSSRFHRLSQFPGPLLWRLTKFTQSLTNLNMVGMKNLERLHREYGEYVRTGK
jgi:hypothetical protein